MVVTGATHHVKFQRQTILGFSQQRMNGSSNTCCVSVAAASLLCRTNADVTAVTVSQRAESDTNSAAGVGSDSSKAVYAKSVRNSQLI